MPRNATKNKKRLDVEISPESHKLLGNIIRKWNCSKVAAIETMIAMADAGLPIDSDLKATIHRIATRVDFLIDLLDEP